MGRTTEAAGKRYKLSRILQVQEIIDFFILSEIKDGKDNYLYELDRRMVEEFKGVGVNLSYMNRRINSLREAGFVTTYWNDKIKRDKHYVRITPDGQQYFLRLLEDIASKVKVANLFYKEVDRYLQKFGKINTLK